MTRDELYGHIKSATEPDNMAISMASIKEGVDELYAELDNAKSELGMKESKINELNQLAVSQLLQGSIPNNDGEEEEHEETLDEFNARMREAHADWR